MMIVFICVGLCVGSFINAAYYRFSPNKTVSQYLFSITFYRSACPLCGKKLLAWQLIPIISWCLLKRRCYYCHGKIAYRYIMVELLVALLFVVILENKGINCYSFILLVLGCWFLLLALIDYNYYLLPDFFTQPLMWTGLILAYFELSGISLRAALIGVLFGYLLLKLPAILFYLIYQKTGLGRGDVKLLSALGTWVYYEKLPLLLIIASLLGIVYFIILRFDIKRQKIKIIPFGPFLLIAGYILIY